MKKYAISTKTEEIIQDVQLTDITPLVEFNPRESLDESYIEKLSKVDYIPAIKLARLESLSDKLIIIDGNHRFNSRFLRDNEETIPAFIYNFTSEEELFKEATLANICHGKMLTKEEKIKAILKLFEYKEKACLANKEEFKISYASFASELGGQDSREIRKIFTLYEIRKVLTEEQLAKLGLNLAKSDILYRLFSKVTTPEFINFFNEYVDLKFGDLNEAINNYLSGKPIDKKSLLDQKLEELTKAENSVLQADESDHEDTNLFEEIQEKLKEESAPEEFNAIEQIELIEELIEEKIYLIDFAKKNNSPIEKDGYVTVIDRLINKLNSMKESLNVI